MKYTFSTSFTFPPPLLPSALFLRILFDFPCSTFEPLFSIFRCYHLMCLIWDLIPCNFNPTTRKYPNNISFYLSECVKGCRFYVISLHYTCIWYNISIASEWSIVKWKFRFSCFYYHFQFSFFHLHTKHIWISSGKPKTEHEYIEKSNHIHIYECMVCVYLA